MKKLNDKGFIEGGIVLCLFLLIAWCVVVYFFILDPWMVSNDIKSKIVIDEPYDDYKSFFCIHDSHDWWNVLISVIDIESGNSTYCSLKYNRGTGELKGTFNGVSLKNLGVIV